MYRQRFVPPLVRHLREEAEERIVAGGTAAAIAVIIALALIVFIIVVALITGLGFGSDTHHGGAIGGDDGAVVGGAGEGNWLELARGRGGDGHGHGGGRIAGDRGRQADDGSGCEGRTHRRD